MSTREGLVLLTQCSVKNKPRAQLYQVYLTTLGENKLYSLTGADLWECLYVGFYSHFRLF